MQVKKTRNVSLVTKLECEILGEIIHFVKLDIESSISLNVYFQNLCNLTKSDDKNKLSFEKAASRDKFPLQRAMNLKEHLSKIHLYERIEKEKRKDRDSDIFRLANIPIFRLAKRNSDIFEILTI